MKERTICFIHKYRILLPQKKKKKKSKYKREKKSHMHFFKNGVKGIL